jgi:hypothetical protein
VLNAEEMQTSLDTILLLVWARVMETMKDIKLLYVNLMILRWLQDTPGY